MISGMAIAKSVVVICCSCQMILILIFQFLKSDKEVEYGIWKSEYNFKRMRQRFSSQLHRDATNHSIKLEVGDTEWKLANNFNSKPSIDANDIDQKPVFIGRLNNQILRSKAKHHPLELTKDYHHTLSNFEYLLNEPHMCRDEEDKPPYLLVQVHSHFTHKPQRDAIRDTWGRIARDFDRDKQVRVMFLVGRDDWQYLADKLIHESKLYRDIVVVDFMDTYRNLTLKSLAGLHWTTMYCSNTAFLLKADDDMYLNVSEILSLLDRVHFGNNIFGALNENSSVVRKGLWAVDETIYPEEFYPPYCAGNAYAMNIGTAFNLLAAAPKTRMLPIEDVYVTGILAKVTGRTCQGHPSFPHWYVGPSPKHVCSLLANKLCGIHNVQYEQMYKIFKKVQYHRTCDVLNEKHDMYGNR